jgi:hypothetical protein
MVFLEWEPYVPYKRTPDVLQRMYVLRTKPQDCKVWQSLTSLFDSNFSRSPPPPQKPDFYLKTFLMQLVRRQGLALSIERNWMGFWPIRVAARSKAWTVFAFSNTWIVGSNPTRSLDVCVRLYRVCVVLCTGRGFATGLSPVQGVLLAVYWLRNWKVAKVYKDYRPIDRQTDR